MVPTHTAGGSSPLLQQLMDVMKPHVVDVKITCRNIHTSHLISHLLQHESHLSSLCSKVWNESRVTMISPQLPSVTTRLTFSHTDVEETFIRSERRVLDPVRSSVIPTSRGVTEQGSSLKCSTTCCFYILHQLPSLILTVRLLSSASHPRAALF